MSEYHNYKFKPQPLQLDKHGTLRFVPNRIVDDLLTFASEHGFDMNRIAIRACYGHYTQEEQTQFAQLIGYSVSGWGTLSYVSDEDYDRVNKAVTEFLSQGN